MKIERILIGAIVVLAIALFAQMGFRSNETAPRLFASWRHFPKSEDEAKKLSSHIVMGKVERIEPGKLQPKDGEKFEEDVSLPAELVTIRVQGNFMGAKVETINLFHTGTGDSPYGRPAPKGDPPPKPDKGALTERQRPPQPSAEESRPIILSDDPGYKEGETYLLFLMDGPELTINGKTVKTMAVISPEGRYLVGSGGTLEPISHREGFAQRYRGRSAKEVGAALSK
ncbi:MAG: hypothetical protein ABIP75_20215 [Pyrinomonadaceae bacterium]